MDLATLTYERDGGVALVTLQRPNRLNAWTRRMEEEYRWAVTEAGGDPDVRVVVVTGAGRGFCAGADFEALNKLSSGEDYGDTPVQSAFTLPTTIPKPVIAAVNGPAAGVGFVLMCFADIRFAAAGAKLTTSFARLGLPAEHGASWILPRLLGPARAADILFSARVVVAEEAAELGLVNKVLPPDELLPYAMDYARRIAEECSPSSLAAIKGQMWRDWGRPLDDSVAESVALLKDMLRAPDFAEGVAAFQAKRPPKFDPLPG